MDVTYRIERGSHDEDWWEPVDIAGIYYKVPSDPLLIALLNKTYNKFNPTTIIPFHSRTLGYGQDCEGMGEDHYISLETITCYPWDRKFALYKHYRETNYLSGGKMSMPSFPLDNSIIFDEVEYWSRRRRAKDEDHIKFPPTHQFFIRTIETYTYADYFKDFRDMIVPILMTAAEESLQDIRLVCSFT